MEARRAKTEAGTEYYTTVVGRDTYEISERYVNLKPVGGRLLQPVCFLVDITDNGTVHSWLVWHRVLRRRYIDRNKGCD